MTDNSEADKRTLILGFAPGEEPEQTPVYQKPILRKYDQIEQVKPYGPSELEAG